MALWPWAREADDQTTVIEASASLVEHCTTDVWAWASMAGGHSFVVQPSARLPYGSETVTEAPATRRPAEKFRERLWRTGSRSYGEALLDGRRVDGGWTPD